MILDFTNYTFSGLIALLAAILGIGYPMFLESIRKIDEQYDSTRLSARYQRENVFHWYRRALLVSIVVSFCAPFLMLLFPFTSVSIVIVTLQAVAVQWLVFKMLDMFQVVQEYYNPARLIERIRLPEVIEDDDTYSKTELLCLIDLMRYAARRDNNEVYESGKYKLIHLANKEESSVPKDKSYNVSAALFHSFRQVAIYSKDSQTSRFFNDNIVSQSLYNYFFDYNIGPQTYQILWYSACIVAEGGSEEWFRQHWSNAVQYYTFRLNCYHHHDEARKNLFLEHHFMLGVMAIFYKRYDWLKIVLFHTHVHPPEYPLVPSTFRTTVDMLRLLESQRMNVWQLTQKYQMKGLFADVNSDDKILLQVYRYAALLLIRLFSVNDYNITYSDPLQLPDVDPMASIYQMKEEIQLVERISWQLNEWYGGGELSKAGLPVLPPKTDVEGLLNQYKESIETQMQYNEAHPVLDRDKMGQLKALLAEVDRRSVPSIPTHDEGAYENTSLLICVSEKLDNHISAVGGYQGWSNYPDVLLALLNDKLNSYYDGLFVFIDAEIFTINEKNVFKALSLIKLESNDVIVAMGVYLPHYDMIYNDSPMLRYDGNQVFYKDIEVESHSSDQSSIIIIRREMVPTITYLPPSADMQHRSFAELQNSPTHLCSNIDQVINDNQPSPIVRIGRNISSHIPADAKCIRLVVSKGADDVAEISRLESYMNTKEQE